MYFLIILLMLLLLLAFIVIVLLAVFPVKIFATANLQQLSEFHMVFTWLRPFLKCILEKNDDGMLLNIYLFNRGGFTKNIQNKGTSLGELLNGIKIVHLKFIKINVSYGFEDPSITGMVFGAVNFLSDYLDIDVEYNHPDFNVWDDYFSVRVSADTNPLSLMLGYFKSGKKVKKMNPLYGGR